MPTVPNAARVAFFTDVGTFCYPLALRKISTGRSVWRIIWNSIVYQCIYSFILNCSVRCCPNKMGGKGEQCVSFHSSVVLDGVLVVLWAKITPAWGQVGTYLYAIKAYKGIGHNPQAETCQRFIWQLFIMVQFLYAKISGTAANKKCLSSEL